jgi:hypothetical protein
MTGLECEGLTGSVGSVHLAYTTVVYFRFQWLVILMCGRLDSPLPLLPMLTSILIVFHSSSAKMAEVISEVTASSSVNLTDH